MYEVTMRDGIREWVLVQGHSQRSAAARFGVSRDTVARLLDEPPEEAERRYRRSAARPAPVRETVLPHLEGWIKENVRLQRRAPKQRWTAHRMWQELGRMGIVVAASAIKLQVRLDLLTGALQGPLLQDGRVHDLKAPAQTMDMTAGALRLADLGYFSLDSLQRLSQGGVFWLTRWQARTVVLDEQGQPVVLLPWLAARGDAPVDCPVLLGQMYRLSARLLVVRVPPEVAKQRRSRLHAEAQRRGQAVSQVRLAAADWTIYLTNVPADRLTLQEARVLGHARWQIELLFQLWKSQGGIDESRSAHPWRMLCELYAKLLGMVIQHWILLTTCWRFPNRSPVKAAQTIRSYTLLRASALAGLMGLQAVLAQIERCLVAGCRMNPRKQRLNTYQLLLAVPA